MGKIHDLSGKRFGRLTVIRQCGRDTNRNVVWECKCDCGNTKTITAPSLIKGKTQSCGCLAKEMATEQNTTHSMSGTKIYHIWTGIIQRCTNPKEPGYPNYGGRGIRVCDEWRKFENFYNDMGESYKNGLSIERKNVDGNYEPSNCKWATRHEQNINKRNSINIHIGDKAYNLKELSSMCGIKYPTLKQRFHKGWSVEKMLSPVKGVKI